MDIAYTNARTKGLRARLLKKEDYRSLMEAPSLEGCLELLRSGFYGVDIDRASVRYKEPYSIISHAIGENTNREIEFLWKITPQGLHTHLRAFFYPWDGYNLKAVIRLVVKGGSTERLIDSLLPVGRLSVGALKELCEASSLEEVALKLSLWGEPLGGVLRRLLKSYGLHKNLFSLEFAIDRFVLTEPLRLLKGHSIDTIITRRLIAQRIDCMNILTLFKIHREGYGEEECEGFFIEGGRMVKKDVFKRLATIAQREALLKGLIEEIKDRSVRTILGPLQPDQPWMLEERLEELVARRLLTEAIREPLTIASVFEYLYRKLREVKNIRLLVRAKLSGMPESRIKEALIEPWQA